ncbi:MAG: hypothetical protein ACI9T7_001137 [Oleiphilaceae bacterium]|jgi:hypothetical protein
MTPASQPKKITKKAIKLIFNHYLKTSHLEIEIRKKTANIVAVFWFSYLKSFLQTFPNRTNTLPKTDTHGRYTILTIILFQDIQ